MRQWAREAELGLAQSLRKSNYPLAAAAYATRYLRHPAGAEERKEAQAIVDYARWTGYTAAEIEAAGNLRSRVTHMDEKRTFGDTEFRYDYVLSNGNGKRLRPLSLIWYIEPIGKQGALSQATLGPRQTVRHDTMFTLPKGRGQFSSRDILILPIRACPEA